MTSSAVMAALAALVVATSARAFPTGSPDALEAQALCNQVEDVDDSARDALLERSRALAEKAIAADQNDAAGHFARFCAVGKQIERMGLGFGQLSSLRLARKELDEALRLAPTDTDTLAAKGAMLFRLPSLFGGDNEEAERLLRAALAADPSNDYARCYLSRTLRARGADADARALAPRC